MTDTTSHYRLRMVAALIARNDVADLLAYIAPEEQRTITPMVNALAVLEIAERDDVIREYERAARTEPEFVLLADVHPAWIVDVLLHESPRIIGLIMRFLPSRHTRYVLEHLPHTVREQLPHMVEAFAVSDAVLRLVRRWFEQHFTPTHDLHAVATLDFTAISALSLDELAALIHDLGIQEMAHAFARMPKEAVKLILNRLPFDDAQALMKRLSDCTKIDPQLERDARYSILELRLEQGASAELIAEVGALALAKAFQSHHYSMLATLKQKLPPRLAYLLQRDVDMALFASAVPLAIERQSLILSRFAALIESGVLRHEWKARLETSASAA